MSRRIWGSPDNGSIVFLIEQGHETAYTCVYEGYYDPLTLTQHEGFKERKWPATLCIYCEDTINGTKDAISEAQIKELCLPDGFGWDCCAHSWERMEDYSVAGTWTEALLRTSFGQCRNYLDGLGVKGSNIFSPQRGLYEDAWLLAHEYFNYIVYDTCDSRQSWPHQICYQIEQVRCSDKRDWDSEVKPGIDEIIGHPEVVAACIIPRVAALDDTNFKFWKTTDNGASYFKYSVQVTDGNPLTSANLNKLDTEANGDWLLINIREFVSGADVTMTANVNANNSVMSGYYWTEAGAWAALADFVDGTEVVAGKTLSGDGSWSWTSPEDWGWVDIGGLEGYWVKLTVDALLSNQVGIDEIRIDTGVHNQQISLARLDTIINYVDTLDVTIRSVSQLCLMCSAGYTACRVEV